MTTTYTANHQRFETEEQLDAYLNRKYRKGPGIVSRTRDGDYTDGSGYTGTVRFQKRMGNGWLSGQFCCFYSVKR